MMRKLLFRRLSQQPRPSRPTTRAIVKLGYRHFDPTASRMDAGIFPLESWILRTLVPKAPGAYVILRRCTRHGAWVVLYVGRARKNLSARLLYWVRRYPGASFTWREVATEAASYTAECEEFTRYGGTLHLDNVIDPSRTSRHSQSPCREVGACLVDPHVCHKPLPTPLPAPRRYAVR